MKPIKLASEAEARERARAEFSAVRIVIIESRGSFYLEREDDCPLIRTWEREVFAGLGRKA